MSLMGIDRMRRAVDPLRELDRLLARFVVSTLIRYSLIHDVCSLAIDFYRRDAGLAEK